MSRSFLPPGDWLSFCFISSSDYYSALDIAWGCCQIRAWGLIWGLCALKRPNFWMECLTEIEDTSEHVKWITWHWGHGQPGAGQPGNWFCTQSICVSVWPSPAQVQKGVEFTVQFWPIADSDWKLHHGGYLEACMKWVDEHQITTLLSLLTVRFVLNSLCALDLLCWSLCHQRKKRRKQQVWLWKCKCDNEESLAD